MAMASIGNCNSLPEGIGNQRWLLYGSGHRETLSSSLPVGMGDGDRMLPVETEVSMGEISVQ